METLQESLDNLETLIPGLVIMQEHKMGNHQFKTFLHFDAARWTGRMENSIYVPIVTAKVEIISPVTGDYSQERPIVGDNFFRR